MAALSFATAEVHCRFREQDVTVRFLTEDGWHPVEILSCSAFEEPTALACGTPCLQEAAACPARRDGGFPDREEAPRARSAS